MKSRGFHVQVRLEGNKAIIDLHGEINGLIEAELNEAYAQAEELSTQTIALNFTEVEYINSTGIALIVSLMAQARKTQRSLIVFGLSDHYTEIFKITRLAEYMSMYPDEDSAISS